ncbi:MAG: VCBS repeat-containing protein [Bacteroidales bacterium]|nr:VCBS repeat-containing protein [Bacteroidales bacterium]
MKKHLLLLLLAGAWNMAQADHHLMLSDEIHCDQNMHIYATDYILLNPGFKAEAHDGYDILIDIDAYDINPPATGIFGGPLSQDNGVVGALGGIIDVGAMGAATYAIPIELPKGLGGLCPQLCIYYNNQKRNGLLGWNWDLGGLSAITRNGKTLYHDNQISAVNYNDDRFSLDGQRLMCVSGDYGSNNASYRTEQDQMNKIVSYSESGFTGPSYFKVWTADGKILSYGNSSDSKALINSTNNVNVWLLKSIEDRYGNLVEYHYQTAPNMYWLTSIDYSGNSNDGIAPRFSVEFQYNVRTDSESMYVGNCLYRMNQILNTITVKNQGNLMGSYQFEYQEPNAQYGYCYHLLTSIKYSAGGRHLNPTRIEWGTNNFDIHIINETNINVNTSNIESAFAHAVKFNGDLNGDGYTDVIAVRSNLNNSYYSHADVFLNKGLSSDNLMFDHVKTIQLSPHINWIYVADFNGDGRDDILLTERNRALFPFCDHIETKILITKQNPSGTMQFTEHVLPSHPIANDLFESLLIGDFFGEGKQSILIQALISEQRQGDPHTIVYRYNDSTNEFQSYESSAYLSSTRFFPADYNGDGATEIMYKNSGGATTIVKLRLSNNIPYYSQVYHGDPCFWEDCYPGDFNGDGITDALFYQSAYEPHWSVSLFNTLGISETRYGLSNTIPYDTPDNPYFTLDNPNETEQFIKVGDFDGNGCSDLILKEGNTVHVYYGPLNSNSSDAPFSYSRHISTTLFHYFNNMDICLGNFLGEDNLSFLGNYSLSHLPSMSTPHEVKRITDGFGRKIEFQYEYLMPKPNNPSENDFYYCPSSCSNYSQKIYSIPIPLRALKKLTTYNIKNKPITTECQYHGALLHKQGKGFLGFSKTIQKDYCNNQLQKRTTRQFEMMYSYDVFQLAMAEESVFDKDNRLMAKSTYSNLLYHNLKNSKVFVPITNKTIEEYDVSHPENLLKKEINETVVSTNSDVLFKYDEIISTVEIKKGITNNPNIQLADYCEFQTKTLTEYAPNILNSWLINRPSSITTISHSQGNDDIYRQKLITYNSAKPFQVKSITEIPNDGSHPEDRLTKKTTYQYDLCGNIITQIVSTPNDTVASRTESFEFSKNHGRRLLTKHKDAAGHITLMDYHPVYSYCISNINCNQQETRYEQDPFGITSRTYHPDSTVTCHALRWSESGSSFYRWEKKTGLPTKITTYAMTGEILSKSTYSLNGESIHAVYEYDNYGRIKEEKLPYQQGRSGNSTSYDYDQFHRIRRIDHLDGSYEIIQYDGPQTNTSFHSQSGEEQIESKTLNTMGWVIQCTDANGVSVIYEYNAEGKPKWTQIEGLDETRIEMDYDALGNRILLIDPDYGTTTNVYNAFNELVRQTTPNQDVIEYVYDKLGNKTHCIEVDNKHNRSTTTEWQYGKEEGRKGLLVKILSENQSIDYDYDEHLRLSRIDDHCLGKTYTTSYTYDNASRVSSILYPSNFRIQYCYTSEGHIRSIMDQNDNVLWRVDESNAFSQPTKITTGNGITTEYHYDHANQRLIGIHAQRDDEVVQDYVYEYDGFSNMTSRYDMKHSLSEHFTYDNLNRLTNVFNGQGESQFCYDELGRMIQKTREGETIFSQTDYSGPKPHALKSAQTHVGVFPQERMDIEYNAFGKVTSIKEGEKQISYLYGFDHQRIKMVEDIDSKHREKIYVNGCEFITQADKDEVVRTFLSCPSGVFAVVETVDNNNKLFYIHKDHLGSWTTITDQHGTIEQENNFDAWGNSTNGDDLLFDRGYTGHEHIRGTGLVNMNGRLYDPVTSSMLSPDNYIQMPELTQNFNRYSYCINNPLIYTDPDGNSFVGTAFVLYLLFCTDYGYEVQKAISPIAIHLDIHLCSQQIGIGFDVTIGIPKSIPISVSVHGGMTYYWRFYDNSYQGMEYRIGTELCLFGIIGISGTYFKSGDISQTTNAIILGNENWGIIYENDYMFHIGDYLLGIFAADNGDRYRTAAAKIRIGPLLCLGVNLFTGDPGVSHDNRNAPIDPETNRATYALGKNGENPDEYRAGVFYVGIGPIRMGANTEELRNIFQNRFAHDFLCQGDSPYFRVLDRPAQTYFYFGSGTGNSLW